MDIKLHKKETHGTRNVMLLAMIAAVIFAVYKWIMAEDKQEGSI